MKDIVASETVVCRPNEGHWPEILAVLRTANFHRIGSVEMAEFPLEDCFVALVDGVVRGVGGYRVLCKTEAKTTLLAVDPDYARLRLGERLQAERLNHLRSIGIKSVTTNTDDPRVAAWLERKFGFHTTGRLIPKEADFGRPDVTHWTNLRVDW